MNHLSPELLSPAQWTRHEQTGTWADFTDPALSQARAELHAAYQAKEQIERDIRRIDPRAALPPAPRPLDSDTVAEHISHLPLTTAKDRRMALKALGDLDPAPDTPEPPQRPLRPLFRKWHAAAIRVRSAEAFCGLLEGHEAFIRRALDANKPVSTEALKYHNIPMPPHYSENGVVCSPGPKVKIDIYHAAFGASPDPSDYKDSTLFEHVATLTLPQTEDPIDALSQAFHLTNHIDRDWRKNLGVTALTPQARSSSVGDVFVLGQTPYTVKPCGFEIVQDARTEATQGPKA